MKLYYAPGACSLAALIAAEEAGLKLDLAQVRLRATPHTVEDGSDFRTINPKGYVPVLQLEGGAMLTEGVAILQYLDEQGANAKPSPARPPIERYRAQEWLTFIATELHKTFSPWLFHPEYGQQAAAVARARIADRFDYVDRHLQTSDYLLGSEFAV